MQDILALAREDYPDLDDESAVVQVILKEKVKDVFFLDKEGKRCILRESWCLFFTVCFPLLTSSRHSNLLPI